MDSKEITNSKKFKLFGADNEGIVHSLTKYIGGLGTVIGGIIIDGGNFDWTADPKRQPLFNEPDPSYGGAVWGKVVPELTGANVPFADKEIFFGPIAKEADKQVSIIPDFISNCGMARTFSYLMEQNIEMTDFAIFESVSKTIYDALQESYKANNSKKQIARTAFEIALKKLSQ
mgnify:CR=1 FL=1